MKKCRICGHKIKKIIYFGKIALVGNFYKKKTKQKKYDISLNYCLKCKHVQISEKLNPKLLFKNYLWETGISKSNILILKKLLSNLKKIQTFNFQGTTKCPGLVHKDLWNKVGGWSEEFSPTGGDDTDFAMKLWVSNVRIFKGLGKCSAYHFGSVTTRKKDKKLFTYLGSRGNKIFLKKWGFSINFFEKYYLKSGLDNNKQLIFNEYKRPLSNPIRDLNYYIELLKSKLQLLYLKILNFKY